MKCLFLLAFAAAAVRLPADPLPGTQPLQEDGDLAAKMVQGIHRFLDRETAEVAKARAALWKPDTSSPEAWEKSMEPKRARLRQLLGMVEERSTPEVLASGDRVGPADIVPLQRSNDAGSVEGVGPIARIEWKVMSGYKGEGLKSDSHERTVIILPDIGTTPEQLFGLAPGLPPERQLANRLAATGCSVIVPVMIDRRTGAKMPEGRTSRLSQREVLWRAGFEMGRTVAGYEIQKILSLVDWLATAGTPGKIGLLGCGENGRLAMLAGALDSRIAAVAVDGGWLPLDAQWQEPIDTTVFGIVREFGAAEVAAMIAPRRLDMRLATWPEVIQTDAGGGAPGVLRTPDAAAFQKEVEGAAKLSAGLSLSSGWFRARQPVNRNETELLMELSAALGRRFEPNMLLEAQKLNYAKPATDEAGRQQRLFDNLLEDTQVLMRQAQRTRDEYWKAADRSSAKKFAESAAAYREKYWTDITGKLPPATLPPNARSRVIYETDKITGWEVVLDVYADVFSYGILLVPKDLKPGEKRAVVVCQHGLEGRPQDLADPKQDHWAYHTYGVKLAEKGYIVFAPQNPYIGKTEFRQICRKAWPLGLSLWSFIVRQHEVILTWLKTQPNVDASRIAFYGLSYGGKSAMRLPALLPDYCLSICSADYNEWIWKNVDASAPYCYLHTNEYDMVEWSTGNTFNYAELSWLIFPRPFMVERGHDDMVSCDEWVAYEFARTRRHYNKLGLGDRTEIEFFNGPHTINGQGTFRFLDKWLTKQR